MVLLLLISVMSFVAFSSREVAQDSGTTAGREILKLV